MNDVGAQVLIGSELPIGTLGVGVHAQAQLAERGIGVDGHYPVILAELGEDRPHPGGNRGLADAAFAENPDLVAAPQQGADLGLQLRQMPFIG